MAASAGGPEPPASRPELAALLRAWRQRSLLTQEQLAERARLGVRSIRRLESGQPRRARAGSLRLIADALGLSDDERILLMSVVRGEPAVPVPRPGCPPRQLPTDVAGFTGRGEHVARLDAVAAGAGAATAVVISAIAGTAGVGKTALAVHWAHRVARRFPDGQLHVDLRGYAPGPPVTPIQALSLLLRGLGVEGDAAPDEVDAAAGLYRSLLAGRRVLIVLDNVRDAEQVRVLLPGSPGCLVLVTSRDGLAGLVASHGAHRLSLDVLSPQEAVALLARIAGEARMRAEPEAALELAALCGHLPLALRIVGAKLADQPERSLAGAVAELRSGDRLAGLSVEGDQRSAVRGAFDSSYAALDPDAGRLFRLLGLAPGADFDPPAAAALAGIETGRAAVLLRRLAGAHLVERRGPDRYAFHDLLRCYAQERAYDEEGEPERRAAIERLLEWYQHGADAAARLLYSQFLRLPVPPPRAGLPAVELADAGAGLRWLDAERANLVAAITLAADSGPLAGAWLLADTLRGYFLLRRHRIDWPAVARAGLAAAVSEGNLQALASAHLNVALMQWSRAHTEALLQEIGDRAADPDAGRQPPAMEHTMAAVTLAREIGDRRTEAQALNILGSVYVHMGRPEEAMEQHRQALVLAEQIGHRYSSVGAMLGIAVAHNREGRHDLAIEAVQRPLAIAIQGGYQLLEGYANNSLAAAHDGEGRHDRAIEYARCALALHRAAGNRLGQARALITLGHAQRHAGRPEEAGGSWSEALALLREVGATDEREFQALLGQP